MSDFTKKDMEAILRSFDKMRQDAEINKQKKEARLWANSKVPVSLKILLNTLTKDELSDIRRGLGLEGLSALKKQQLIEALIPQIIESSNHRFLWIDEEQYKLLKDIVMNEGWTNKFSIHEEQIMFFRNKGLLFPGRVNGNKALVMPEDLVSIFRALDNEEYGKIIKRNTEWIRLTQGLLYYYGTLDIQTIRTLIEQYTGVDELEIEDFIDVILDAAEYHGEIKIEPEKLSNYRVIDPDQIQQEHAMRSELGYYPFSYEQLIKAGEPGFIDKNHAFTKFARFISSNYDTRTNEAESLVEECLYAIRIGEPTDNILEFLEENMEIDNQDLMQQFTEHLIYLNNNTRQWFLKGYMPSELFKYRRKSPEGKRKFKSKPGTSKVVDIEQYRNKLGRNVSTDTSDE